MNDVPANDGSDPEAPVKDYPWMCKLVLDSSWYLNKYNKNYASTSGTHYLAYPNEVVYARFFSDGEGWYDETGDMPLTVWTTHATPEKYTVTYTDGVDNAEVFADQVYSNLLTGTTTPAFNGTPKRDGYEFKGWNPVVAEKVTGNVTYVATWEKITNNQPNDTKTPQTGDTNNIMLPIVLLVVSFVGMTGLMASFRKKKS